MEIDEELYLKNLKHLAERKLDMLPQEKNEYNRKMKVYRFLSSKGYETDLIREVVGEIENE